VESGLPDRAHVTAEELHDLRVVGVDHDEPGDTDDDDGAQDAGDGGRRRAGQRETEHHRLGNPVEECPDGDRGAAAVLLMRRSTAEKLGQTIIGKYVCASIAGVKPLLMGQGPWKAIPKALDQAGISKDDVDIYEINEAFASQCLWCANELGIPQEKINPKSGDIAFGHPLGSTGARQVSTLLYELKRTGKKVGNTSMCVGTGMGMSAVWVAE